jgi:hypothetical protein
VAALAAVAPSAAAPTTAAVVPAVAAVLLVDPELEDTVTLPLFFMGVSVSAVFGLLAVLFDEDELLDFFASASGAKMKSIAVASTHD